jgi:hypothetical protein
MATRLALPSTLYSDVLGTLRQRKAAGQTITPQDERSAWQSYWDTMASRSNDVRSLGIQEGNLALNEKVAESNIALKKDEIAANKKAAIVSGISSLGGMAVLGGYVLKGTALGSKIGLGAATTGAGAGAATTGGAVSALPEAGASGLGTGGATAGGAAAGGITVGAAAGTAGVGYIAGKIGANIPIGKGKTTEEVKSTASGAAAGAAMGTYVFPGVGTIVGGIIGGASGFLSSACIIITAATSPDSYEVNIARAYRDSFMDYETLRGYYAFSPYVVAMMKNPFIKKFIKKHLVDHFVKYGEYVLGISDVLPAKSRLITMGFLNLCNAIGKRCRLFVRSNGEVY